MITHCGFGLVKCMRRHIKLSKTIFRISTTFCLGTVAAVCVSLFFQCSILKRLCFCLSELESEAERAHHIQQIIVTLPRTIIIVMRYLFAFLNQ